MQNILSLDSKVLSFISRRHDTNYNDIILHDDDTQHKNTVTMLSLSLSWASQFNPNSWGGVMLNPIYACGHAVQRVTFIGNKDIRRKEKFSRSCLQRRLAALVRMAFVGWLNFSSLKRCRWWKWQPHSLKAYKQCPVQRSISSNP